MSLATPLTVVTQPRLIKEGLKSDIQKAWSRRTSADGSGWRPSNAAHGQCAVTALIVQDFLNGEIVRTVASLPQGGKVSHYLNLLPNGQLLDLTASQFHRETVFQPAIWKADGSPNSTELRETAHQYADSKGMGSDMRAYLLRDENTKMRYNILRDRVQLAEQARLAPPHERAF